MRCMHGVRDVHVPAHQQIGSTGERHVSKGQGQYNKSALSHGYRIDASMYWLLNEDKGTSRTLLLLIDLVDERAHAVGEVDPKLIAVLQQGTGLGGPSDAGWGPGEVSAGTA